MGSVFARMTLTAELLQLSDYMQTILKTYANFNIDNRVDNVRSIVCSISHIKVKE